MKLVLGTMFAVLLAGSAAYAQEPDKDKPKDEPQKHEEPRKDEQPAKGKQDEPKEKPKQEPERRSDEHAKPAQQNDHAQQKVQQDRSQEQQRAQQTAQHRDNNAGAGRRVPEEKFRASFGSSHHFHVQRNDDRRFNYGGYYFTYNQAWPGDWDYNDEVYVDEIDGEYYLINPRHPGLRLLVIVAD